MPRIFICYRRDDSAGHAGRLFDRVEQKFGRGAVFMDVVGIDPGIDFQEAIDRARARRRASGGARASALA